MLSFLRQPLSSEDLIERSRRFAGLGDFGDTTFREGLETFLRACADEANLSLFGHLGLRWDVRRFLSNLLRMRLEELRVPEILEQPIERPLFIAGLPRSGTTFLHGLLAMDDANLVRGSQPRRDLLGYGDRARNRNVAFVLEHVGEVLPFNEGHREVLDAIELAEIVNPHDVLVGNLPGEHELPLEASFDLTRRSGIEEDLGPDHLQGNGNPELVIPRLIHDAHASGAKRADDVIPRSEGLARGKGTDRRMTGHSARPGRRVRIRISERCFG